MIDTLFRQVAADRGWNGDTQIEILLRYAADAGSTARLYAFLAREQIGNAEAADPFTDAVIAALRNPGLALDDAFRRYCAGCRDLLTPRQAAERWCYWRGA